MSIILNVLNYFWKLRFNEEIADLYIKKYHNNYEISIDFANETMNYGDKIHIYDDTFKKFSQKNFIILETVDRFLSRNYRPEDIHLGKSSMYDLVIENISNGAILAVRCMEFEEEYDIEVAKLKKDHSIMKSFFEANNDIDFFCAYTSRLKAGSIEFRYAVFPRTYSSYNPEIYLGGLFEEDIQPYFPDFERYREGGRSLRRSIEIIGDFEISNGILMKYTGNDRHVVIPNGVERLGSSVFWNCTNIEDVTIPNSVTNLGGDTFFSCENLRKLTIPHSVKMIGDNPFAICPKLDLVNESPYFVLEDDVLYNKEKTQLIQYSIKKKDNIFKVPNSVISIGKHTFVNCHSLRKIIIPPSVRIIENNPFSNLPDMRLENNSPHFIFKDGALYNKTMTTLFYYEHGFESKNLVIPEGVSIIGRHSFYNCKSIKTLTIPKSVKIIGYNPFTGCTSLSLINHSPEYVYENGALYNKTKTDLIYFSIPNPAEEFVVPNTIKKIGRSAFFGCSNLKKVVIPEGVVKIERSAFANCSSLSEISIPKSLESLGEWAFADCNKLKNITLPKRVSIKAHTFINCSAEIKKV